ncbi:MAG TPA: type II toxin-antitoxin system VapC family toxin [Thermoanaerobaculia bacterium]|nr:type II toxin-antitoxin system VapC family toxin [Thermoanaerobaculia bacterium]
MFILDTDTCVYVLEQDENVLQQLLSTPREDVFVSVITEAELRTGAAKSGSPIKTLHLVENFLRPLTRIDFTSDDAIA